MRHPVDQGQYFISQGYSGVHPALDIAANHGVAIKAPESGVIALVNNVPTAYFGGNYIVLNGDSGHRHYMGHNSKNHVNVGQRVSEGQHIADIGSTGQATGPHTHWEVSKNGSTVNPVNIASKAKESTMAIIQDAPNWHGRMNKTMQRERGRGMSYNEMKVWFGEDFLTFYEAVSDNKEADQWYADGLLGRIARKDKWKKKINDLEKKVKDLGELPTQAQLDALEKQSAALKASADTAIERAEIAKAEASILQKQADADKAAGETLLRRAGQFFTKYLGGK